MKRAFRGPFCLEIQKKLLVNHIKSTNSLVRLRGCFVTAPNQNLPHDRMREEIKHELMHIINDDFYLDEHVNLVEQMVRRSHIDDSELENIDFYHHFNV